MPPTFLTVDGKNNILAGPIDSPRLTALRPSPSRGGISNLLQ